MNNWKQEFENKFNLTPWWKLLLENLLEEAKKEERERIINEIENVVNWLFMNYEEKIDIMKERLE